MLQHKFVEFIPEDLQDGTIYISLNFCTAIHKCVCGCGKEVVTPLSPTDWELTFNGKSISLFPSIGNWSFPCQSHYWITNGNISYASKWDRDRINTVRRKDKKDKKTYYNDSKIHNKEDFTKGKSNAEKKRTFWDIIRKIFER